MNEEPNIELMRLLVESELPARLDVATTAKKLNFTVSDITTLIAAKLLTPLGSPAPNAPKYFQTIHVFAMACDERWLNRATKCCADYWRKKRHQQKSGDTSAEGQLEAKLVAPVSTAKPSPESSPAGRRAGDKRALTGRSTSPLATAVPTA